ncbi:helix-turn-helix domain-containing protein [Sorangium sp. So ce1504]|uniref:TetR/AcrR family transcriptional regulator n=1 Tax=Sorangium sp. So ce1504 TaxID=3133337 RepID=UPI003F5E2840
MSHTPTTDAPDPVDDRIVRAAERLLRREGPGFTMQQLARTAGVSRATLYRRVPSREALVARLRARAPRAELERSSARARILEAARRLVARHGAVAITVEQIAREAGTGTVTIYRTFGDKDGLLRATFDELTPRRDAARELADLDAPIEQALARFLATALRFIDEQPGLIRLVALGDDAEASYFERLRDQQTSTFGRLARYLDAQAARGRLTHGDAIDRAAALLGMVMTASLFRARLARSAARGQPSAAAHAPAVEARAQAIVELFLRGAAPRAEVRA